MYHCGVYAIFVPEGRSLIGVSPPLSYNLEDLIREYLCGIKQLPSFQNSMGGMEIDPEDLEQLGRLGKWINNNE